MIELGPNKEGMTFSNLNHDKIHLICSPNTEASVSEQKLALDKCLFSFPLITGNGPNVIYENEQYHVELSISSEKYTSSLISYISKAGFQVQKITKK